MAWDLVSWEGWNPLRKVAADADEASGTCRSDGFLHVDALRAMHYFKNIIRGE